MSEKNNKTTRICFQAMKKIKDDIPKDCEVMVIVHSLKRKDIAVEKSRERSSLFGSITRAVSKWSSTMESLKRISKKLSFSKCTLLKDFIAEKKALNDMKSIWEKRRKGLL